MLWSKGVTVAIILLLFVGASSCKPDTPVSREASGAHLTADPDIVYVREGAGASTITWDTGSGEIGQLYVSLDGQPEALFAQDPSGRKQAPWIQPNHTYEFRLYRGVERQALLATVRVTGRHPPTPWLAINVKQGVAPPTYVRAVIVTLTVALLSVMLRTAHGEGGVSRQRVIAGLSLAVTAVVVTTVLVVEQRSLPDEQPQPDSLQYADAARRVAAGQGYFTTHENLAQTDGPVPPRYPPGFSLALAPFVVLLPDYPANVQLGAKVLATLFVLVPVGVAWSLAGPVAGALAASLIGLSPFAYTSAALVLSDALSAAITVLSVGLLHRLSRTRASLAGLLVGVLTWIRVTAVWHIGALLLVVPSRLRVRVAVYAMPLLVGLGLYHWLLFGSPFQTGYDQYLNSASLFSISNLTTRDISHDAPGIWGENLGNKFEYWVCGCNQYYPAAPTPNYIFYPAVLLGLIWVFSPPLMTVPGLVYLIHNRRNPAVLYALLLVIGGVVLYLFYAFQMRRFVAGPALILVTYSGVALAEWLEQRLSTGGKFARDPGTAE